MKQVYKKYLLEYGYENTYSLEQRTCTCNLTLMQLRDGLLRLGNILKEDKEKQIYIVSIKAGVFSGNNAVVICGLEENKLVMVSFAREGVFKQNTCKKAMDRIEENFK